MPTLTRVKSAVEPAFERVANVVEPAAHRVVETLEPAAHRIADAFEPALDKAREAVREAPELAGRIAAAGAAAATKLTGKTPPPPPKKHRLRKTFVVAGVASGAVAGYLMWKRAQADAEQDDWEAEARSVAESWPAPSTGNGDAFGTASSDSDLGEFSGDQSPSESESIS